MATRNRKGQMERDVEQAMLDAEAVQLRAKRMSYPEIAGQMGCSLSTAYDRVKRAIAAVPYEAVEELRRIELESLDELEQKCRAVLTARHVKVDHGQVIMVEGVMLLDDAPVLHAAAQILRIKDMRAKLTGEYAATKAEVKVEHTTAADAELERLAQLLASRAAQESAMADRGAS